MSTAVEFPWVVVGFQKLTVYDTLTEKPRHRSVQWYGTGIWAELAQHFTACASRRCLVLLSIDPETKVETFQHGEGGPHLQVAHMGGFSQLGPWLAECHRAEDERDSPRAVRLVLGLPGRAIYDQMARKPAHGDVEWAVPAAGSRPHPCRERRCLLLMTVDEAGRKRIFQHGDPGPTLEMEDGPPNVEVLGAWLKTCHDREDAA